MHRRLFPPSGGTASTPSTFPQCGTIWPHFSTVWKNQLKVVPLCGKSEKRFSIVWNDLAPFFHSVEKSAQSCSIVWKIRKKIFHCVERFGPIFPQCGKISSKLFHCVENPKKGFPLCGTIWPHFSTPWKNQLKGCRRRPRGQPRIARWHGKPRGGAASPAAGCSVAGLVEPAAGVTAPGYSLNPCIVGCCRLLEGRLPRRPLFHSVERFGPIFPQCGKINSKVAVAVRAACRALRGLPRIARWHGKPRGGAASPAVGC